MASASSLSPTFFGHIASTQDALLLFEACLSGTLNHVARRPHDRERSSLIKSGNVFIYEEHSSGIKRWTDGVPWSPSRILGNFLVYRELERPFPPGEKKRAMKRNKRSPGINKAQDLFGTSNAAISSSYNASCTVSSYPDSSTNSLSKETERSLIGSLVDSYGFKEEGLVKKTVSVTVGGVSHHLVSYYTVADVMNNKFTTPSKDPRFQHTIPRADLITKQNFRTPIDEIDSMESTDRALYNTYSGFPRNGYEMTNQSLSSRSMSLPTPPVAYPPSNLYGSYAMSSSVGQDSLPTSYPLGSYNGQFAPSPSIYTASKSEAYDIAGGYGRQRYNSIVGMGSDSSRSQVPPAVTTNFNRRGSLYDHNTESSLSGISTTSVDSKMSSDSGYASQSYYSNNYRDNSQTHHDYPGQRSLPAPTQASTYDRSSHPYLSAESPIAKETLWTLGNSGGGHGHYIAPQQQWASTGTS
jgi:hypothetical protein